MVANKPNIDLQWVDEFIENVRSYIFVRSEDNLLIKRPNQVQKLNSTGAKILKFLLKGHSINDLIAQVGMDANKIEQIDSFLTAVRSSLEGTLEIFSDNPAVSSTPFEMNFSKFPILSELAVTYRCNLACAFCYAGCNNCIKKVGQESELTTQELRKIIKNIYYDAKVPSISFTGGEPTIRSDLPELISCAKSLGMRVNLITNGTRITKRNVQEMAKAGLDSAQVSIEGCTPEIHDKLVRVEGAFSKAMAAVSLLKKAGIHVHTNTTLNKKNVLEAGKFPEFVANELGLKRFSMNMIIPTGTSLVSPELQLCYSEIGPVIADILKKSKQAGVEFMWYSPLPICMFNTITHGLGNKGCAACDGLLSIAPNGDVLPCSSLVSPVGNMLDEGFSDVWYSEKAQMFRSKSLAHGYCKSCEHFSLCNGACPLYWEANGYSELEEVISVNSKG